MALRKIISRALDVGIVGVYVPVVVATAPFMVMNPSGIVTVLPSIATFSLIGMDCNTGIFLKAGAISLPFLFFGYIEYEDNRREKFREQVRERERKKREEENREN